MSANYDEIKDYLLGRLDPVELRAVDLRLIEDEDFGSEAMAAEDALIESYVDGELTDDEAGLFRSNYLTTAARAQRVREFVSLRAAAARTPASSPQAAPGSKDDKWNLSGWLFGLRPAMALAAVALVAVVGAGVWIYFAEPRPTALEREYAELNRSDMKDLSRFSSYSTVELVSGRLRSDDAGSKVAATGLSDTILFRLPLAFEPPGDVNYRAELRHDGRKVFSVDDVRPVKAGPVDEVRLLLPRAMIGKGQHQIALTRPGTNASPVLFDFVAE